MEFYTPGQLADTPSRTVPQGEKRTGDSSREAFDAMRKSSAQRPKTGDAAKDAAATANSSIYFDNLKGWYQKGADNHAVPFQSGGKPYFDEATGKWVKPLAVETSQPAQNVSAPKRETPTRETPLRVAEIHPPQGERQLSNSHVTSVLPVSLPRLEQRQTRATDVPATRTTPLESESAQFKPESKPSSADAFMQTAQLLSRLPDGLQLKFDGRKASLEADMVKLMEALPGVQVNPQVKEIMSHVKRVQVQDGHVTLDLKSNFLFPLPSEKFNGMVDGLVLGNRNQQVSFDTAFDRTGNSVRFSHITGIAVHAVGDRTLRIHDLSINATGSNPTLGMVFDNPKIIPLFRGMQADTKSMAIPISSIDRNLSPETIRGALQAGLLIKNGLEHRETMQSVGLIQDTNTRMGIQQVLGSVRSITKYGDSFEITRSGGATPVPAGGSEITFGNAIRFKVGNENGAPSLSAIEGISVRVPMIPGVGLSDAMTVTPRRLTLDLDAQGRKAVKVHTD